VIDAGNTSSFFFRSSVEYKQLARGAHIPPRQSVDTSGPYLWYSSCRIRDQKTKRDVDPMIRKRSCNFWLLLQRNLHCHTRKAISEHYMKEATYVICIWFLQNELAIMMDFA
jgi:hypothetical protein